MLRLKWVPTMVLPGLVSSGCCAEEWKHDAVDALRKPVVGEVLVGGRRIVTAAGEGFGPDELLSIHVRRRCRHANVHIIFRRRMHPAEPEFAHGNVHFALGEQRIFEDLHRDARRFRIEAHPLLLEQPVHGAVMGFGEQVNNRAAKVPEEPIAQVRAADDAPGQHRQDTVAGHSRGAG